MPVKTLLENDYIHLIHDEENSIIKIIWKGFASSSEYRQAMETVVDCIEKNHIRNWYSDLTKAAVVQDEDKEWLKQQMPRVIKAGLKKIAAKISPDIFNQMYTEDIILAAERAGLFTRNVENMPEALTWFKE